MQYNNKPQGQDNEGMNNNSSEGRRNETGAIPFEQTGSKNISSIPYVMVAVNAQELMTEEIEEEETGQEEEEETSCWIHRDLLLFRATRATAIHNKLNREGKQGDCSQI